MRQEATGQYHLVNGKQSHPSVRYLWRKPANLPERMELYDSAAAHVIGEIIYIGRKWHWRRNTSTLLHGAPPKSGVSRLLADAKIAILDGLPDATAE